MLFSGQGFLLTILSLVLFIPDTKQGAEMTKMRGNKFSENPKATNISNDRRSDYYISWGPYYKIFVTLN